VRPSAVVPGGGVLRNKYEYFGSCRSAGVKSASLRPPTSPCRVSRQTLTSFLRPGRESSQPVGSSVWQAFSAADVWRLAFSLKLCAIAPWGDSIFSFGTSINDCVNWDSFGGFPKLRQALFLASESVLTAKCIFANLGRGLESTPQRRCGGMVDATDLKSVGL
jgi:hypothetical protein